MAQTDYAKLVKHRLIDMEKTQTWLCEEVARRTGTPFNDAYLSKILRGFRGAYLMRGFDAINEILGIDEQAVSEHAVSAESGD